MRYTAFILLAVLGCGNSIVGGSGSGKGGNGSGGTGSGSGGMAGNTGPAPGPGPGVTGGGQVGGGVKGGTGPAVTASGESSYWLQNTSIKVQPTTAPGTMGGGVSIEGARGATESYQVVLLGALTAVDGVPTDLSDGAGHTIAAGNVQLYREDFVDFTGISTMGGTKPAPGSSPTHDALVPDALVPLHDPYTGAGLGAPFDVAAGKNQPVWIDVRIAIDQAVGTYTGALTFTGSGGTTIKVPLSVTVWDITLPDMRAIPTWFRIDYSYLEYFHDTHDCYYSRCTDAQRAIITRYQNLVHEHRMDPRQTLVQVPNVNGCATTSPDFGDMDNTMGPYMDGSYFADGVPSSVFQMPFGPGPGSDLETCGMAKTAALAKSWADHLKAKGWWDRSYVFGEDEPSENDLPAIGTQGQWLAAGDPGWKARIFDTTYPTPDRAAILDPGIGIYVLCLKCYDMWYFITQDVLGRAQWAQRLQQGLNFWFYESNAQGPPYPGFASNTLDAGEPRIMMWGSWYEGATGFLYWAVNNWDLDQPWGPTIGYNKTGDGMIVYPGNHNGTKAPKGSPSNIAMAGPIPSIRLKMGRSGLQDWALFLLADRNNLRDMAKTQLATVYGQMGACDFSGCPKPLNGSFFWKTDYELMQTARRNIVTALLAGH